jgi:dienelactone hydrolase
VHGGAGKAFPNWVKQWASQGYAAIAMDLRGRGEHELRLENGGPDQTPTSRFEKINEAVENHWLYHAVTNVILAHSLIRSFPAIDPDRTAVIGISWGGYLSCIAASLDHRFRAAVSVYGCGFIDENSAWRDNLEGLSPEDRDRWIKLYEPSHYLPDCQATMLFVTGDNDPFYPLDSYVKSFGLLGGAKTLSIEPNLVHGYDVAWEVKTIKAFIDHYLQNDLPLPVIFQPQDLDSVTLKNGEIIAKVINSAPIVQAQLHYSFSNPTATSQGAINERQWETPILATWDGEMLQSPTPPEGTKVWFLTVTDDRGVTVSTIPIFTPD